MLPKFKQIWFRRDAKRSMWTLTIFNISSIWRVDALGVNGALL